MLLGLWSTSVTLTLSNKFTVSIIKCGIIFGGNICNSGKMFTTQKKTVRMMAGAKP